MALTSSRWRFAPTHSVINSAYPAAGRWSFIIERLVVEGEQAITDVVVSDGVTTARALTFTTVRHGRILGQVEYWPNLFDAPDWRAAWVERTTEQSATPLNN